MQHDPNASMTGMDVKFSDAMSSMPLICLSFSFWMSSYTNGSAAFSVRNASGNTASIFVVVVVFNTSSSSSSSSANARSSKSSSLFLASGGPGENVFYEEEERCIIQKVLLSRGVEDAMKNKWNQKPQKKNKGAKKGSIKKRHPKHKKAAFLSRKEEAVFRR